MTELNLLEALRLASVLNSLHFGEIDAAVAEARLRLMDRTSSGQPHHVSDPNGICGLETEKLIPIRLVLSKAANQGLGPWFLLTPTPGRHGGFRSASESLIQAMETGALVVEANGKMAWLPKPIGPAMQWLLVEAQRPTYPISPAEASRNLSEAVIAIGAKLAAIDNPAGTRPDEALSVHLGEAYSTRCQRLLDRAMFLLKVADEGLKATSRALTTENVLAREKQLRNLRAACLDAISASASWPQG